MDATRSPEALTVALNRHLGRSAGTPALATLIAAYREVAFLNFSFAKGTIDADELRVEYDNGELMLRRYLQLTDHAGHPRGSAEPFLKMQLVGAPPGRKHFYAEDGTDDPDNGFFPTPQATWTAFDTWAQDALGAATVTSWRADTELELEDAPAPRTHELRLGEHLNGVLSEALHEVQFDRETIGGWYEAFVTFARRPIRGSDPTAETVTVTAKHGAGKKRREGNAALVIRRTWQERTIERWLELEVRTQVGAPFDPTHIEWPTSDRRGPEPPSELPTPIPDLLARRTIAIRTRDSSRTSDRPT